MTDIFKELQDNIIKLAKSNESDFLPLVKSVYGDKPETLFKCARFASYIYDNGETERREIIMECHKEFKARGDHKNIKKFKEMFPEILDYIRDEASKKREAITVNIHPAQPAPEQFKRMIELEKKDAIEQIKKASLDRPTTESEGNLSTRQWFIKEIKAILKREGKKIEAKKITEAINSIEQNDFSKADKLFSEIEMDKKLSTKRASDIAFARGYIADYELRWKDAAKHYVHAAQINPCYKTFIRADKLTTDIRDHSSALLLGKQAEKAAIAEHGEGSAEHAVTLNNLALIYMKQKKYAKAEPFLNQCLKIRKKVLGEEHPDTADCINSIAGFYHSKKYYRKAEPFFIKALKIKKKVLDESDPNIALSLYNLAGLYYELKRYKKAEKIGLEALDIYKKAFGINDLRVANCLHELADIYQKKRQYEKAEPLYQQALQIHTKLLGERHPDTASNLHGLSLRYFQHGCYPEAELLCRETLSALENTLGSDHPDTKSVKVTYDYIQKRLAQVEQSNSETPQKMLV